LKKTKKKTISKKSTLKKTKKFSSGPALLGLNKDIWPMERDVFFRPARLKYVRKLMKKEGCVFCYADDTKSQDQVEENLCVFKTKYSQIVINKFPYNSGHLLILPLRHCGDFLSLQTHEYTDLMQTLKMAVQAVTEIYNPQGYNLGLNNGSAAGAGIPDHLHFHLVPRWNGDLNFFPLIAETKLVIENVEDTVAVFKKYFQNYKAKGNL
jgi:ATP adenylyltransferase